MNREEFLGKVEEQQNILFNELKYEKERSAVIVGVSNIDSLLEELIVKVLKPVKPKDSICYSNNGVSTFSSKIMLAFQLGLIDESFKNQLNMLRKIRNDFSHQVTGCSLDMPPHSNRFDDLYKLVSKKDSFKRMPNFLPGEVVDESERVLNMKLILIYLSSSLVLKINFMLPLHEINSNSLSLFK
ncbi:MAG: hypothetical protein ACKVH6_19770 [Enterobacterales bacterium]